jgi:hypothetical protein
MILDEVMQDAREVKVACISLMATFFSTPEMARSTKTSQTP